MSGFLMFKEHHNVPKAQFITLVLTPKCILPETLSLQDPFCGPVSAQGDNDSLSDSALAYLRYILLQTKELSFLETTNQDDTPQDPQELPELSQFMGNVQRTPTIQCY
ncbi:hypothetical protein DSO57_1019478 [Entomophthora muscae]|uniref:Uncharacterized protein n=1 Tax=Entomophthora muscae TaxID=34485 RepID=A0ACC2T420_9FUNG|nr:hypothetical protein DSO57_1019478 [Entomophthora muscae]